MIEHIHLALAAYRAEMALFEVHLWQLRLARMTAAGWSICFPIDELAVAVTAGNWRVRRQP